MLTEFLIKFATLKRFKCVTHLRERNLNFYVLMHTSSFVIGRLACLISSLPSLSHSAAEPPTGCRSRSGSGAADVRVCPFIGPLLIAACAELICFDCMCKPLLEWLKTKKKTAHGGPRLCLCHFCECACACVCVCVSARLLWAFVSQCAALIL